jgi:hypothetical protein
MMTIWRKWGIDDGTVTKVIEIDLVNNLRERSIWHESKVVDGLESGGGCAVLEFHGQRGKSYGGDEGVGLVIQGF